MASLFTRKPSSRPAAGHRAARHHDAEDIQRLADEIVGLCQTSAYDDMTWAEIDNALRLASHDIKVNWSVTGSVAPV